MSLMKDIKLYSLDDPFIKLETKRLKSVLRCLFYTILFQRPYKNNFLKLSSIQDQDLDLNYVIF